MCFGCVSVESSLGARQRMPKERCVNNCMFGPPDPHAKANAQNPAIYPHHSSRDFWWPVFTAKSPRAQVLTSGSEACSASNSVGAASTSSTSSIVKSWRSSPILARSSWKGFGWAEPPGSSERFCKQVTKWLDNWGWSAKPPTKPRISSYKLWVH